MRKIRDVLRYRHSTGLSLEAIARALNLSKGVVAKYLRLAGLAGLGWPLPEDLDDVALEKRLYQQPSARVARRRTTTAAGGLSPARSCQSPQSA